MKTTGEGTNWWAQNVKKCVYSDYVHTDRLGSVVNLTDQYGRVPAQVDYDDWGKVTAYRSLNISGGYRTVLPEIAYAGHQYDDVLGMYYAKVRMYDAENRRFTSVDPIKGRIIDPMSMVQYLYVVDDPLRWVDLLGLLSGDLYINGHKVEYVYQNGETYASIENLMGAMGGYYCCETSELKHKDLPNGKIEFWEVDTSTTYISRLKNFEWEVDKTKLDSSEVTSQITWIVSGPMRGGDKISINIQYNLDFIKFRKPTINDEIIGVDINQFMNWYYQKFSCIPTIEFEIGEGGL